MLLTILCIRRYETAENLASRFGVSKRTIYRDVETLSCLYPVVAVRGRYGGGVRLEKWFQPSRKQLAIPQELLLHRLKETLSGNDLIVMNSILVQFGTPRS